MSLQFITEPFDPKGYLHFRADIDVKNKIRFPNNKKLRTTLRIRNFSGTTTNEVSLGRRKISELESIDIYTQQGVRNLIKFAKASREK
jgi:hypothetical protein